VTLRLFAALALPEDLRLRLTKLQKGVDGAKWRPVENFHITLAFFGDLTHSEARELDANLGLIQGWPFEVTLRGAGAFGGKQPHTLWMGVEPCAPLMELAGDIRKAARQSGLSLERRAYTPHVTLAYLDKYADASRIARFIERWSSIEFPPFPVMSFELYSSKPGKYGPNLYEEEAVYPLKG